jgi:hypothetical protein
MFLYLVTIHIIYIYKYIYKHYRLYSCSAKIRSNLVSSTSNHATDVDVAHLLGLMTTNTTQSLITDVSDTPCVTTSVEKAPTKRSRLSHSREEDMLHNTICHDRIQDGARVVSTGDDPKFGLALMTRKMNVRNDRIASIGTSERPSIEQMIQSGEIYPPEAVLHTSQF